jgi:hypothetical protein
MTFTATGIRLVRNECFRAVMDLAGSASEIRRMFTALCGPPPDEQHARRRPRWHHRHQERARWPVSRFPVIIEA